MATFGKTFIVVLGICLVAFGGVFASAASISYVGEDVTTNDKWRTNDHAKAFDLDGDNVYGTAGYYAAIKTNAGVDASPDFMMVTRLWGSDDAELSENYQASFDDPDLTGPDPVADILCGDWWGGDDGEVDVFRVELTQAASFRLGVLADQTGLFGVTDPPGVLYESPKGVRVRQDGGPADGGMQNTLGPGEAWRNADVDYFFFDVSGEAGDVFIVSGLDDDRWSDLGMAGFTVDVPEPSTLMMLAALALASSAYCGVRRRRA